MIQTMFVELMSVSKLDQHSSKNNYFTNKVIELQKEFNNQNEWRCDTFNTLDI